MKLCVVIRKAVIVMGVVSIVLCILREHPQVTVIQHNSFNTDIACPRVDSDSTTPRLTVRALTYCQDTWGRDLDLILPVPPNDHGYNELKGYVLPSLALFWPPENLNLMLLTDGESPKAFPFSHRLHSLANEVGIDKTKASVIVAYSFIGYPKINRGWDRQQWLMFWADNFTRAAYVGFLDSDAVFVTPVLRSDLFVDDRPIVRAVFGKPYDPSWWPKTCRVTFKAIGRLEPLNCMSYFPVILKTKHFPLIREHIRLQLNKTTFDQAFAEIMAFSIYSQFSIMCAYMWYYLRDEYYWTVREREPNWKGPFAYGQESNRTASGLEDEYLQRYLPALSIHWSYEHFKTKPGAMQQVLRTGVCYTMLPSKGDPTPDFCKGVQQLTEAPNEYEWTFEGYTFLHDKQAALTAHRKRLSLLQMCPRKLDRRLLKKHFSEV